MSRPSCALDHLVVAADTLDQGAAYIAAKLGIAPADGGRHAQLGTYNRVLKLGGDRYLEVIAIDPAGVQPDFPRWFDLDNPVLQASLKSRPRLVAWVARTHAVDSMAAEFYGRPMIVRPMQRGDLRWRFAFTIDGKLPAGGLIPYLIQWEADRHPTALMTDSGRELEGLDGVHGEAAAVRQRIASMGLGDAITVHPAVRRQLPSLSARIRTPAGVVVLD
ncbi:MAG TPA: VOC family protein [Desulfosarcina sp.]|nr:VOC family protein [Desulfosarcina sp.]